MDDFIPSISNKVYVFIDFSNLWQAQKAKRRLFNYEKLRNHLIQAHSATEIKIFFYTAYPAEGTRTYDTESRHKFYAYLKKGLGFIVRKKELKRIHCHSDIGDSVIEKGNMDVEMTIDAISNINDYDTAILFTGDSDFLPLVNFIKNKSKAVYIYSSNNNVSKELRTAGSGYRDILDIGNIPESVWGFELKHRDYSK